MSVQRNPMDDALAILRLLGEARDSLTAALDSRDTRPLAFSMKLADGLLYAYSLLSSGYGVYSPEALADEIEEIGGVMVVRLMASGVDRAVEKLDQLRAQLPEPAKQHTEAVLYKAAQARLIAAFHLEKAAA